MPKAKQFLDSKFSFNKYNTKKTGMQAYKAIYSGADYIVHYKYSGVLNIIYLSMMYGIGLPLLFPIGAFNFFNQWICERLAVAYVVR